jgi:hypothetical protein
LSNALPAVRGREQTARVVDIMMKMRLAVMQIVFYWML